MDEEYQKRNTDCVYFLASPLTCKKGIECEYRHNEIARLNPRDCWYWLAGSCLNPTCAFRHPPLDGRTETASESAFTLPQSAAPVNKTSIPCLFYYSGFCNKGERCSFLHGPVDTAPTWKSSKTASAIADGPSLEKKTFVSNDSGPAPAEIHVYETVPKGAEGIKITPVELHAYEIVPKGAEGIKITPVQDLHQPTSDVADHSASSQISESPSKEAAEIRLNSLVPGEAFVQSLSHESTDESSDNQVDQIQEEWLESSPGFDVLVNDRSEDLDYENDALYLLRHDVEDLEHSVQHLGYGYENNIEYDPAHPDIRIPFEEEVQDFYDHTDNEDICNSVRRFPFCERERVSDRTLRQKRNFVQTELASNSRSRVDLRDYLKKRRVTDGHNPAYSEIKERPHMGHLHQRLASKVEIYSVGSQIENKSRLNNTYQRARAWRSCVHRSRHHFKERRLAKRQNLLSAIPGKTTLKKGRSPEESMFFTGPKTLAQIKEEKKKALENGNSLDRTGSSGMCRLSGS